MITAAQFKKGAVITIDGTHWFIEDYHIQQSAKHRSHLHARLRHMRNGHVVERSFDETDKFEQPEIEARPHQYLYHNRSGYVFMDSQTFDQLTVDAEVIGNGKWLLKEGEEFTIRLVDGRPVGLVLPPVFVDEVVETGEPALGHGNSVPKDARLACGLMVKVPQFIRVGERIRVDTETHKYHGKESDRHRGEDATGRKA
jgi:elongation factor P